MNLGFDGVFKGLDVLAERFGCPLDELEDYGVWLVHGLVRSKEGELIFLAWLESPKYAMVFESSAGGVTIETVRIKRDLLDELNPLMAVRYTPREACLLRDVSDSDGPWSLALQEQFVRGRSLGRDFELLN